MEISSDIFASINKNDKTEVYKFLAEQAPLLLSDERDSIANAANLAALIYHTLPQINWAGFYLERSSELVLGPFQGKPACVRIQIGRGVCGTAAQKRETVLVANVHEFPGHIACDAASNSEIVVPLVKDESLIGVLDIDSPVLNRFDEEDQKGLENIARIFIDSIDLSSIQS